VFTRYCKRRRPDAQTGSIVIEPTTVGLDNRILNTVPILFYSAKTCDFYRISQGNQCVICLGHLRKGDLIRWLPLCGHVFHVPCIDNWFHAHSNCPICRSPVRVSNYNIRNAGSSGDGCRSPYITRTRSGGVLCHCNKLVLPIEGLRPKDLINAGLSRSLSMDQSCVVVDLRDPLSGSSYNSYPPLSKIDFVLSRLYQAQSNRYLEPAPSMAPRSSFHGLRVGGTLRNNGGEILPY